MNYPLWVEPIFNSRVLLVSFNFQEISMSDVTPVSGGGAEDSIAKMEAAFDRAIELSSKVTEITTEKKAELDASKQRPQN